MRRGIADPFDWSGGLAATHKNNGFGATRCEVLASLIEYQHLVYYQDSILQPFFRFALKFAPRFRMSRNAYEDVRNMTTGNIYALPRKANLVYSQSVLGAGFDALPAADKAEVAKRTMRQIVRHLTRATTGHFSTASLFLTHHTSLYNATVGQMWRGIP